MEQENLIMKVYLSVFFIIYSIIKLVFFTCKPYQKKRGSKKVYLIKTIEIYDFFSLPELLYCQYVYIYVYIYIDIIQKHCIVGYEN